MTGPIGIRIRDWCLSLGGIATLIAGAAAIDGTFRRYLLDALGGRLPAVPFDFPFQHLTREIAGVVPTGNVSFMAFGAAALVLFALMFRS